jgi:hypothetical protein
VSAGSDPGRRISKGTKAQEGEASGRRQRRSRVQAHPRRKATEVRRHAGSRAHDEVGNGPIEATRIAAGTRTPGWQRAWRHAAAAGGKSFEGYEQRREEAVNGVLGSAWTTSDRGRCGVPMNTQGVQETRRTPGSAAGCNKPASPAVGKPARSCETARSERDREGGTSRHRRRQRCRRREHEHREMMSMEGWQVRRTSVTTAAMSAVAGWHRDESQERRSEAPTRALEQEPWRGAKLTRAGQCGVDREEHGAMTAKKSEDSKVRRGDP